MTERTPPPVLTVWIVAALVVFLVVLGFIGGLHPAVGR